jgi:hypothetical protein
LAGPSQIEAMSPPKAHSPLLPVEICRRKKALKNATASCAIEGLTLSEEDQAVVEKLALTCETTDEMVERFIKYLESTKNKRHRCNE